jgi:hypothetical protein
MQNSITANELKTRGIKIIEAKANENREILITLRGITKYAIVPIEYFNELRKYEIEMALKDSITDIKNGKFIEESVAKHIKRILK